MSLVPNIIPNDWESVRQAIAKISTKLGTGADVTHASITSSGLVVNTVTSLPSPVVEGKIVRLITDKRLYFGLGT